jgi:hypothetical protein
MLKITDDLFAEWAPFKEKSMKGEKEVDTFDYDKKITVS